MKPTQTAVINREGLKGGIPSGQPQTNAGNNGFRRRFVREFLQEAYTYEQHNMEHYSSAASYWQRLKYRLNDYLDYTIGKFGYVRKHFTDQQALNNLLYYFNNIDQLQQTFRLLNDDYSRSLMIKIMSMRVLGEKHVRLPVNNEEFWNEYKTIDKRYLRKAGIGHSGRFKFNQYVIPGRGNDIIIDGTIGSIHSFFKLEQYAYKKGLETIRAQPGDVVIDAGSCWGDSALYFADLVGSEGRVLCFEFEDDNLEIMYRNFKQNPELSKRISLHEKALWNVSGNTIKYGKSGPSTSINRPGSRLEATVEVETVTIDDLVVAEGLSSVDFIHGVQKQ